MPGIIPNVLSEIDRKLIEEAQNNPGIASGFKTLDFLTCGFHASELIVLAARPDMGKTTLALNILKHAAIDENNTCLMFSLETDKEHLLNGLYTIDSGIDANELENSELGRREQIDYKKSAVRVKCSNLVIDDTPCSTVAYIRSKCKEISEQKQDLKLVIIDYLQLMGADVHCDSREEELTEISKELKQLAVELKCPVIVLAQLPNTVDRRSDKRPRLEDLKKVAGIEKNADTVLLLHTVENCNADSDQESTAEIIIAKRRVGRKGSVMLEWQPRMRRFVDRGDLLKSLGLYPLVIT